MIQVGEELKRLDGQLTAMEGLIDEGEEKLGRRAPRISEWSVAQQLDHVTKVLEASLAVLESGNRRPERGINLVGRILLGIGRLPRGVGKSPSAVRGVERPGRELLAAVRRVRATLERICGERNTLSAALPVFPHPYFRGLTPAQTLRFLAVHTDHHLRIVADIRSATGS